MNQGWTVHKFGGASLAGPWEFCRVAEILAESRAGRQAVVVSASYGVTDRLLRLLDLAVESSSSMEDQLELDNACFRSQSRQPISSNSNFYSMIYTLMKLDFYRVSGCYQNLFRKVLF